MNSGSWRCGHDWLDYLPVNEAIRDTLKSDSIDLIRQVYYDPKLYEVNRMIKRVWLFELGREVRISEPKKHFAAHADAYVRYISVFLYPQGCRAFFADVPWIGSHLRVLDAGCGTGIITFALLEAH